MAKGGRLGVIDDKNIVIQVKFTGIRYVIIFIFFSGTFFIDVSKGSSLQSIVQCFGDGEEAAVTSYYLPVGSNSKGTYQGDLASQQFGYTTAEGRRINMAQTESFKVFSQACNFIDDASGFYQAILVNVASPQGDLI
jgi:hypothetical protein